MPLPLARLDHVQASVDYRYTTQSVVGYRHGHQDFSGRHHGLWSAIVRSRRQRGKGMT